MIMHRFLYVHRLGTRALLVHDVYLERTVDLILHVYFRVSPGSPLDLPSQPHVERSFAGIPEL